MGIAMRDFGSSFWGDENVLQLHGSNDSRVMGGGIFNESLNFSCVNCVSVTLS